MSVRILVSLSLVSMLVLLGRCQVYPEIECVCRCPSDEKLWKQVIPCMLSRHYSEPFYENVCGRICAYFQPHCLTRAHASCSNQNGCSRPTCPEGYAMDSDNMLGCLHRPCRTNSGGNSTTPCWTPGPAMETFTVDRNCFGAMDVATCNLDCVSECPEGTAPKYQYGCEVACDKKHVCFDKNFLSQNSYE